MRESEIGLANFVSDFAAKTRASQRVSHRRLLYVAERCESAAARHRIRKLAVIDTVRCIRLFGVALHTWQ
jgi:hypothetical protein